MAMAEGAFSLPPVPEGFVEAAEIVEIVRAVVLLHLRLAYRQLGKLGLDVLEGERMHVEAARLASVQQRFDVPTSSSVSPASVIMRR